MARRGLTLPVAALVVVVALGCVSVSPGPTTSPPGPSTGPTGTPPATSTASPTAAPPTASPTAAPTATPTPSLSPADVAEEFARQILTATTLEGTITGEIAYGTLTGVITGELRSNDDGDYQREMTLLFLDTFEVGAAELKIDGVLYSATNGGPWVLQPPPDAGSPAPPGLDTLFLSVAGAVDQGPVVHDGRTLHHLLPRPDVTVDPAALGLADPDIRAATATIEFYAEPDGTPAAMVMAADWLQTIESTPTPSSVTMEVAFTRLNGPDTISAPADPWEYYVSDIARLTTAHPAGWSARPDPPGEVFDSSDGDLLWMGSKRGAGGADLDTVAAAHINAERLKSSDLGYSLVVDDTVNLIIDGQAARVTHLSDAAEGLYFGDAVLIVGKRFYVLQHASVTGSPEAGRAFFEDFLTTVKFPD